MKRAGNVSSLCFLCVASLWACGGGGNPGAADIPPETRTEDTDGGGPEAPCPEIGTWLGTGGACIPAGIQGCAANFIEDGQCRPSRTACEDGTIPVFGSGCEPVGIAGCVGQFIDDDGLCRPSMEDCAAGEIPIMGEGCAPVGPANCAEEFRRQEWHGVCVPSTAACEFPDEMPDIAQGCVSIDGPEGCGDGPWGNIDGTDGDLYVDGDYDSGDSDGTAVKPYADLDGALAVAADGDRIVLAAGTYFGSFVLGQDIQIVGVCPSQVALKSDQAGATVTVTGGASVVMEGLTLTGSGAGIQVNSGASADLRRVRLLENQMIAARCTGGTLQMSNCLVAETQEVDGHGIGVYGEAGAVLELTDTVLYRNVRIGLVARDPGTRLEMVRVLVDDTRPTSDGLFGVGISATDYSDVSMVDSVITGSYFWGLNAYEYSGDAPDPDLAGVVNFTMEHSVVADTRPATGGEMAGLAYGAVFVDRNTTITGSAFVGNNGIALNMYGKHREMEINRSLFSHTKALPAFDFLNTALYLGIGGSIALDDSVIVDNDNRGIAVSGAPPEEAPAPTTLDAHRVIVARTNAVDGYNGATGVGIMAGTGGILQLEDSLVSDNAYTGVMVTNADSAAEITRCLIEETRFVLDSVPELPGVKIPVATGVDALDHVSITLTSNVIRANGGRGVELFGVDTAVLQHNLIEGTRGFDADGDMNIATGGEGVGLMASYGPLITVGNVLFENTGFGVVLTDVTPLDMKSDLVESTRPTTSSEYFGIGLMIGDKTRGKIHDLAVVRNRSHGMVFLDPETSITLKNLWVAWTGQEKVANERGLGVLVQNGPKITVLGALVEENFAAGILDFEANLVLTDSVVRKTQEGFFGTTDEYSPTKLPADGIMVVGASANAELTGVIVLDCERAGLFVESASGALSGSVIRDTNTGKVISPEGSTLFSVVDVEESGVSQSVGTGGLGVWGAVPAWDIEAAIGPEGDPPGD